MSKAWRLRPEILREAALTLLRLTEKTGSLKAEELAEASFLTSREAISILEEFAGRGLIDKVGGGFRISPLQRAKLALESVRLGVPPDKACKSLSWSEFERAVRQALELNGYEAVSHLKIKVEGKLSEIDIFAIRGKTALLVDCKHWRKPLSSLEIKKIVEIQNRRLKALKNIGNLEILRVKMKRKVHGKFYAIPVVITLFEASQKIRNGIPIVPVSKLANFLDEAPAYLHNLKRELIKGGKI
jgi:Holliday junction resolvase